MSTVAEKIAEITEKSGVGSEHPESAMSLALGILLQAMRDFYGENPDGAWHRDAREWFESEQDEVGSFLWVCQGLDLDADALRNWANQYDRLTQPQRREVAQKLFRLNILRRPYRRS